MLRQLDLGCGSEPALINNGREGYEHFGLDIVDHKLPNFKQADLAIEPLPYASDSFDLVTAHELLEHIPKVLYIPGMFYKKEYAPKSYNSQTGLGMIKRNCIIELFNEVYRVLKDGGEFFFDVPTAGTPQYYGDPTHVSEWTPDSVNYFSGDYFGFHDDYGHTSKFKKINIDYPEDRDWQMRVTLKAVKPMEPPYDL